MNLKMADLKLSLEQAGFFEVQTFLSSGNAAFKSRMSSAAAVERKVEAALAKHPGRTFLTIVRSTEELQHLLEVDPYSQFTLPEQAKRVVTFARKLVQPASLPIGNECVEILATTEREGFSYYTPGPDAPTFMTLIEKTFGKEVTTRTWETVRKCAKV